MEKIATGTKFGKLTTIEKFILHKVNYWKCQCDCGNTIDVLESKLLNKGKRSCGCYISSRQDLTNKKFEKLTVISPGKKIGKMLYWICKCECGVVKEIRGDHLRKKRIRSCGCININNIIGQRFGKLEVLKLQNFKWNGILVYECKCDCGNTVNVRVNGLVFGGAHQCKSCNKLSQRYLLVFSALKQNKALAIKSKYFYLKKFKTIIKIGIGERTRVKQGYKHHLLLLYRGTCLDALLFEQHLLEFFVAYRKLPQEKELDLVNSGKSECFCLESESMLIKYIVDNAEKHNLKLSELY